MSHIHSLPRTKAAGTGYWHGFRAAAHHAYLVMKYLALRGSKVFVRFTDGRSSTIKKAPRIDGRTWIVAGPNGSERRVDSSLIADIGDKGGIYGH